MSVTVNSWNVSIVKSELYTLTENLNSRSKVVSLISVSFLSNVVVPVSAIKDSKLTRPVIRPFCSNFSPCGRLLTFPVFNSYTTDLLLLIVAETSSSLTLPVSKLPRFAVGHVTTPATFPIIVNVKNVNSLINSVWSFLYT